MTTTGRAGVILVVLAVLMPSGSALATERVSVDSSGAQANQFSFRSSISADGRFVAFESNASNLVAGDGNFSQDVFVRDRQSGTTELVSVGSSGNSSLPAISADGRFVAFANGPNVYVRDRQDNVTELVGPGFQSSISGDGRYVAFVSLDSLVPADTNSSYDVYVHDRDTDTTQLVSVDSLENVGDGNSGTYNAVSISADGRLVAFSSQASNLVADDTNGQWDVFVHDRDTGTTERMSVDSSGNEGNPTGNYFGVSIDAAGRNVAFESDADNLVADDTNALVDVFVRDRQNGTTKLVSLDSSGGQATFGALDPSISGDGRFVAFRSASAMVPGDTNLTSDVFVRDLANDTTVQASVNGSGTGGNNYSQEPSLDNDGGLISYASDSTDLVAGDTNGATDVFVTDLSVPPPGPPTGVVAAAGDGSASVSWVAPTAPGSSTIDSYSVTPHDTTAGTDGAPVSSPSTSANAAGLTNGHIYTFTVTASGPGGTSADSASSNAVTPQVGYPQPASASGDASTTSSTTVSTGTDPSATGGTAS